MFECFPNGERLEESNCWIFPCPKWVSENVSR
jgi:hypothetical protein